MMEALVHGRESENACAILFLSNLKDLVGFS
jgi:hypothetical protein